MTLKIFNPDERLSLVGKTFNYLTVRRKTTERQNGHVIYECICVCGRLTRVRGTRLTNGITIACGSCQRELGEHSLIRKVVKDV